MVLIPEAPLERRGRSPNVSGRWSPTFASRRRRVTVPSPLVSALPRSCPTTSSLAAVLKRSDDALYAAKDAGRDRVDVR